MNQVIAAAGRPRIDRRNALLANPIRSLPAAAIKENRLAAWQIFIVVAAAEKLDSRFAVHCIEEHDLLNEVIAAAGRPRIDRRNAPFANLIRSLPAAAIKDIWNILILTYVDFIDHRRTILDLSFAVNCRI